MGKHIVVTCVWQYRDAVVYETNDTKKLQLRPDYLYESEFKEKIKNGEVINAKVKHGEIKVSKDVYVHKEDKVIMG